MIKEYSSTSVMTAIQCLEENKEELRAHLAQTHSLVTEITHQCGAFAGFYFLKIQKVTQKALPDAIWINHWYLTFKDGASSFSYQVVTNSEFDWYQSCIAYAEKNKESKE